MANVAKKRKNIIVVVALIAFTIYVLVSLYNINVDIRERRQDTASIEDQITTQQAENDELNKILETGEVDEDYIIRQAREKLNLVFPEERVFKDIVGN